MKTTHRINLQIDGKLYPLLDKALKGLKPRSKAELIRKLAELALVILQEREKQGKEEQQSSNGSSTATNNQEHYDAISSLFDDPNEDE